MSGMVGLGSVAVNGFLNLNFTRRELYLWLSRKIQIQNTGRLPPPSTFLWPAWVSAGFLSAELMKLHDTISSSKCNHRWEQLCKMEPN